MHKEIDLAQKANKQIFVYLHSYIHIYIYRHLSMCAYIYIKADACAYTNFASTVMHIRYQAPRPRERERETERERERREAGGKWGRELTCRERG